MAHQEQKDFVQKLRNNFSNFFTDKKVLEIGSLNINGSIREFFDNCKYTGIDVDFGDGVDIVCEGQNYKASDETYDVVLSTECFEHNPYWLETFKNMIRLCKDGGLVFFTCATDGRPEHGTSRTTPLDSPLTVKLGWDYYRNLTEENFTDQINFDEYFSEYHFEINDEHKDLYFWGVINKNVSKCIQIDKSKNPEYDNNTRKNNYKLTMVSISPYEKIHNVVDCFQYNNEKELLELRVKLLKDEVDLFLIFEGNYTHDGKPKEFTCNKVINELGLPKNKIRVIEIDLSDPGKPTNFDLNYNSEQKVGSIERIQRDYLNNLLDEFDEETVFIVSDCDEIINSTNVKFVSGIARSNKDFVFKIPLVHLEGRADYRVHYLNSKSYPWDRSMFACTKRVLEKNPATHIRSEFLRKGYEIRYVTHGGEICQDLGWHFSWMGSNANRVEKFNALCNIKKDFISSLASGYEYDELIKYIENYTFEDGTHSCYGNFKVILKKYSILELPPIIFRLPGVEQYLIPDIADLKNSKNEELTKLLNTYSLDTENAENNFNLGVWYEDEGHTAPALSYFLRCAERAKDNNLAYEALIRSSYCYQKQGTRDGSAKSLLEQALCLMPERPEAYFLLSRFAERKQWWQDCYIHADRGLRYSDFDSKPLKTYVEYPGKYGLLFEKSIGAWWWGKVDEAKELSLEVLNNYEIIDEHYKALTNNLSKMGVEIPSRLDQKKKFE
jgi:SAM-dependent methyltransferase